jgi:hypothetical protein
MLQLSLSAAAPAADAAAAPQPAYAYDNSNLAALQGPKIAAASWEARRTFMAATAACWSNTCILRYSRSDAAAEQQQQQDDDEEDEEGLAERVALLAVGNKGGCVQIWRHNLPQQYSSSSSGDEQQRLHLQYLGAVRVANGAYVTSLAWAALPAAAAAGEAAAAGSSSSSCAVLPGAVCRRQAGDVLLLAVGEQRLLDCYVDHAWIMQHFASGVSLSGMLFSCCRLAGSA